jgi:hypothetical protein
MDKKCIKTRGWAKIVYCLLGIINNMF